MNARTLQDLFKRYRRPGDLVFSVFFLLFCVFMLSNLEDQTTWVKGGKLMAQPAFWPYLSVISMAVFATLHLISGLVSPVIAGRWTEVAFWLRSIEYAVWFLAYVLIVPILGYLPGTILFTIILCLRLGYRQRRTLINAALFAIVVVVLFKSMLQVKVPGGQIYEYLPTTLRSFMLTYF